MSHPEEELPESQEVSTGSSDVEDVTERVVATGFKRHVFLNKCIGASILFAILTFWLSESAFRPPPVDDEPSWEWFGWGLVLEGKYIPRESGGPIYRIMAGISDETDLDNLDIEWIHRSSGLRDRGAVTMWMLFCIIIGIGFSVIRTRSWKKRFHQDEAYDEPIISLSLLKKIKYAALIMGLSILCFETRNGFNRSQRVKNIQFQLSVVKGNIEDVKDRLSDGADVNVRRWSRRTDSKLLSEEDEELLKGSNVLRRGGIREGGTALHYAAENGQTEIVQLLLSNGADVNAKAKNGFDLDTPLDDAISNGHTEIIELLEKNGGKTGQELDPSE